MAWFPSAPCLAGWKKLDDSSRLDVVEIARVAWHASFHPLQQEETCNSAYEYTPLSNDAIDSFRLREVGRAKDLSALPRIYVLEEVHYNTWIIYHSRLFWSPQLLFKISLQNSFSRREGVIKESKNDIATNFRG